MSIRHLRMLHASEAATQPVPQYISLNYLNLFKIQHVRNPFPLRPVSFSALASYLECPGCTLTQVRKRRPKEPKHFTDLHQGTLFAARRPDPRLVGTLLHTIITILHDPKSSLTEEQRQSLFASSDALAHFLCHSLLDLLRVEGKLKLAMFFDELRAHEDTFYTYIILPLVQYQRELLYTRSVIFSAAERFQCKLLSTGKTFPGHSDWGGTVGIVGEFDQIRLRNVGSAHAPSGVPAIIEFKVGFGKKSVWDKSAVTEECEDKSSYSDLLEEPGIHHAFQLMIYWLAFQTRWDLRDYVQVVRGRCEEIPMPLSQQLDLILYNLFDGRQYQLVLLDEWAALQALITCIFGLDWAMKSGYMRQMPDHDCQRTALLGDLSPQMVQVGNDAVSAEECYTLAREAFSQLRALISWQRISKPFDRNSQES